MEIVDEDRDSMAFAFCYGLLRMATMLFGLCNIFWDVSKLHELDIISSLVAVHASLLARHSDIFIEPMKAYCVHHICTQPVKIDRSHAKHRGYAFSTHINDSLRRIIRFGRVEITPRRVALIYS